MNDSIVKLDPTHAFTCSLGIERTGRFVRCIEGQGTDVTNICTDTEGRTFLGCKNIRLIQSLSNIF